MEFWWEPQSSSLWVAGGQGTNQFAFSTNGIDWTGSSSGNNVFTNACLAVAYGGGSWVAVGNGGNKIALSTDGIGWTGSSSGNSIFIYSNDVAYGNGLWVAGGSNGTNKVAYSTDGMIWTASSSGNSVFTVQCLTLSYGNGLWVAGGGGDNRLAYSTDGITWTASSSGNTIFTNSCNAVAYGNGLWVAGGNGPNQIAYSTNGVDWTASASGNSVLTSDCYRVAYGNGLWVAGGYGDNRVAYSTNGMVWTASSSGNSIFTDNCNAVSYGNGLWVAGGYGTNQLAYSTNGIDWTASTSGNSIFTSICLAVANDYIPIVAYKLSSASPALSYTLSPTTTNKVITGLTPGTDYTFTLQTDISGTLSDPAAFRTVRTSNKPLAVTNLATSQTVVNGALNITFTWTDPNDYASYHVYGLRATAGTKNAIYEGPANNLAGTITFTGLDPARSYTFQIKRGNDAGYSPSASISTTAVFTFNPTTISGLRLWLDANDAGNGTPVSVGTVVQTWQDKSGTTNNATSGAGATMRADSVGRYLEFAGNSYNIAKSSWIYGQTYTIFLVDKPANYSSTYAPLGAQVASGDGFRLQYKPNAIILSNYEDSCNLGSAYQDIESPVNIWCFTNYGGKTAYWNKQISGKAEAALDSSIMDTLLAIGKDQGTSGAYTGRIREILIYVGRIGEDNREAVTNYLHDKWMPAPTLIPLVPVENGLLMWLDAQDATLFQDISGTIPAANEMPVRLWRDKSGYGNDINTIGTGAEYLTNGIGSLPGCFSPLSGVMFTSTHMQTGDATVFIVSTADNGNGTLFNHDSDGNVGLAIDSLGNISWRAGNTLNNIRILNHETPFIFYGTMKKGQLLEGTFIDASGVQTGYTIENVTAGVGMAEIQLCSGIDVTYGEVIYYNRVLSDAEIQENAAYLSNKWRIAIPATNPFSPPAAPGLQLWLDDSPYSLVKSGGTVAVWKDRSGRGNNAVPFGSPTVNNGVVFDGSGQYFQLPDGALPTGAYSYYAVAKLTGESAIVHGGSDVSGVIDIGAIDVSGVRYAQTTFTGDNVFWMAGGYGTNQLAYSINGVTWTVSSSGNSIFDVCRSVAYGNGLWVAGGNGTNRLAYSTDGVTWTASSSGNSILADNCPAVSYGNGLWVAGGSGTNQMAYSSDGITWTASTSGNSLFTGSCNALAYGNGLWVAGGNGTSTLGYSSDGVTWTSYDSLSNIFTYCQGVAYGNGVWVAVGSGTYRMVYSTDGANWDVPSSANSIFTDICYGVAYGNGTWVACGNVTSTLAYSTNGINWTASSSGDSVITQNARSVAYSGGLWIAGGSAETNCLAYSTNGITWTGSANGNSIFTGATLTVAAGILRQSVLTDTTAIPNNTTVIIESLYGGGRSLYLSGKTGPTDTSNHVQDVSNNYIGWDLSGGYMNGTIKEIPVYGVKHTTAQRKQVEQYLKAKWYPSAYEPTDASGVLGLWLDSDPNTFRMNGTGIQTWADKSGQNSVSQYADWAQPVYSLDSVTGRRGVQFGSDGIATGFSATPFTNTNSWSVLAVQRYDYSTDQGTGTVCTAYETQGQTAVKVGTRPVATPSNYELNIITDLSNNLSNAEIHKRAVLTSHVVSNLSHSDYVNGSNTLLMKGWVAVGYNSSRSITISTSVDGLTWVASPSPFNGTGNYANGVAWNGSYYVAVGSAGSVTIAVSYDGYNWVPSTNSPFTGVGSGIAWNGTYWVAVGSGTNCIAYSSDGMNWTASSTQPIEEYGAGIAWNGSYWVATGYSENTGVDIAVSTDGDTWTPSTNNPFTGGTALGVAWGQNKWVAVGGNSGGTVTIATSPDGMQWTPSTNNPFTSTSAYEISWNGSYWLAGGSDDYYTIVTSQDGMTWTDVSNNPFSGSYCYGIAWNGNTWVAVGSGTNSIGVSTDGMTWTPASNNPFTGGNGNGVTAGYVLGSAPTTVSPMAASTALNIGFTGIITPSIQGAMRGYIYEMLVYNTGLSSEDRQAVEGYLAWKWGIQDLLPTTHLYYFAPP